MDSTKSVWNYSLFTQEDIDNFQRGTHYDWNPDNHPLYVRLENSGIWEGFIPGIPKGESYNIISMVYKGNRLDKGDPYANFWERRPATASITWDMQYTWKDQDWMNTRVKHNSLDARWSVYEVHLASWMRPDNTMKNPIILMTSSGSNLFLM